jgi:ferredoxin
MAGNCAYCHVKVTAGEFDWVLSRIEQDESYSG